MHDVIQKLMILLCVTLPSSIIAAEPLILPREDAAPVVKKFFPLEASRTQNADGQNGVPVVREKKFFPLRSDKQSIEAGGLAADRTYIKPRSAIKPLSTSAIQTSSLGETPAVKVSHELEPESDGIEGDTETINPVIALYGTENVGALGSFSEVMRGAGSAASGLARHLMWPIPLAAKQYVSSGYGVRADPFHGRPTFHGGIDIAADSGTAVLATAAGEVIQVTEDSRYGKYVGIQHADGTITRYGHLSSQSVSVGQRVRAGQLIGAVGSTGRSTGAHLDYRVSKNGVKYDPLSILSVPPTVVVKASNMGKMAAASPTRTSEVQVFRGRDIASNPTPKRPMVIQVR